ncbi:type II restriction endonuclease [soil metagenome]
MKSILLKAIQSVQKADLAYCKFLSANDTKATGGHQSGYLVSKFAWSLFLKKEPRKGENIKVNVSIEWQGDFTTSSTFTYYGAAKNEFRLTNFGRNFPYREEDNAGDLFILARVEEGSFQAFILEHDEDIEEFFTSFGISANETNRIIEKEITASSEDSLLQCFLAFIKTVKADFPPTSELSRNARNCYLKAYGITERHIISNPDKGLLSWIEAEYQLFKTFENDRYSTKIKSLFKNVEELVEFANTILNRRKSRAGKSLEHHLGELFNIFKISYSIQGVTEDNKKPDFLFPNVEAYHNPRFDAKKLIFMASKTTCKDRWRQILNEADRIKEKHLFTLQQGISKNQLAEMYKYGVRLVVPEPYLKTFPKEYQEKILTVKRFVPFVKSKQ